MANKCSYCGGILELINGKMKCPYCGSYENANITSEQEILLQTASQQLRMGNFDFAEAQYSDITKRFPDIADGFWGLLLARYGIKYEQDFDGKYIPTCYATSYESFYDSFAYKKAISLADPDNLSYFEEQAKIIEDIRIKWIEKASKEKAYDIFISFKDRKPQAENSDSQKLCDERDRTEDSYEVYDLYNELTRKGYRVFFSRVSLRDKTGEAYEPYIFNALNTAKVMILYSSNPEYIESTWVKNEWTRFVKKIKNKEKSENSLIVVYKDFDPGQLPSSLSRLQILDRNSLTFMEDLQTNIKKAMGNVIKNTHNSKPIISKTQKKELNDNRVVITPEVSNMLNIADKCLSKGMFKDAQKQYLAVLEGDENNGHALLGKLLVDYKFKTIDELCQNIEKIKVESIGLLENIIQYIDSNIAKKLLENLSIAILEKMEKYYQVLVPLIDSMIGFTFDKREEFLRNVLNFYILIENKNYFLKYIEEYLAIDENKRLDYIKGFLEIIFNGNRSYKVLEIFDELERYFPENSDDLSIKSFLQAGELCLRTEEKEFKKNNLAKKAENYFTEAITINDKCHEAYWGLLKVHLGVKDDAGLVDSNTDISTQVDYTNATIAASNVDEKVLDYYLDIKDRQQALLKQKKAKKIKNIVITLIVCAFVLAVAAFIFIVKPLQNKEAISSYIEKGDYKAALAQYNSGLTYGYKEEDKPKLEAGSLLQDNDYEAALDVIYENGGTAEISYDGNGGDVSMDTETIKKLSVSTSGEASKPGYYFSGWEMTNYSFDFDEFSANISLKAKYDLVTYNFSYDLDGGLLLDIPESTFDVEHEVTINNPTKVGYTFVGWTVSDEEEVYETFTTKGRIGNIWIKALWEANEYKIAFVDSLTDYNEKVDILYDGKITFPELTKEGYVFVGWTYNNNDYINENYNFAFDVELTAKWEIVTYNVTYHNVLGENKNALTFTCLDKITLLDVEKTNYNFVGWFSDEALTNEITEINGSCCKNIDIYAKYDCKVFEVTYINDYDNTNPISFTIDTVDYDLVDPIAIGRTFNGWYYNDTKIENLSECFNGEELSNIELTAKWVNITYNITYLSVEGLTNTNPLTYDIDSDTIVLSPVSKDYYDFSGWYDNESFNGNPVTNINIGSFGDKTLYAKFTPVSYTITYISDITGFISNNVGSYTIESEITLATATCEYYNFVKWVDVEDKEITKIEKGNHGDITLKAIFTPVDYTITYVLNSENVENNNPNGYDYETEVILSSPSRNGYTFKGWYTENTFENKVDKINIGEGGNKVFYAKWDINIYNISYNNIDGLINNNPKQYTITDTIELTGVNKDYYEFVKWVDQANNEITSINNGTFGDITLSAVFSPISYNIVYVLNNGLNNENNVFNYSIEEQVTLYNPTKNGYNFAGWYTESTFDNKLENINIGSHGDITLYAKWDIITYNIYYPNDIIHSNPSTYTVEDEITLTAGSKDYYTFNNWLDSNNNIITKIEKGTIGDITLSKSLTPINYTITYVLNDGTNNIDNPTVYNYESNTISLYNPTKVGYNGKWYQDEECENEITQIVNESYGDITLYAGYEVVNYNINYYRVDGATNNNPTSYNVETATFTLNNPDKEHYVFDGWYTNSSFTTPFNDTIAKGTTGIINVYAKWTPIEYTITLNLSSDVIISSSSIKYTNESTSFTLPTPTRSGYYFTGWCSDSDRNISVSSQITKGTYGDISFYDSWTPEYSIGYELDGGTNNAQNPSKFTELTETITIKNPTRAYYTFDGWYTDSTFNNIFGGYITKGTTNNITLYAKWSPVYFSITYIMNGGTNSSSNPTVYSPETETFTLINPTRSACYTFGGWYTDSNFSNEFNKTIEKGSHGNLVLYAKWNYQFAPSSSETISGVTYYYFDSDMLQYFYDEGYRTVHINYYIDAKLENMGPVTFKMTYGAGTNSNTLNKSVIGVEYDWSPATGYVYSYDDSGFVTITLSSLMNAGNIAIRCNSAGIYYSHASLFK